MPAQTDPDAPEILRQVETLDAEAEGWSATAIDAWECFAGLAEAALLPLLRAVVADYAEHHPRNGLGWPTCGCHQCIALRAVAEALGKEGDDGN